MLTTTDLVALVAAFVIALAAITAAVAASMVIDWWRARTQQADPLAIADAVGVLRDRTTRTLATVKDVEQRRTSGGAR